MSQHPNPRPDLDTLEYAWDADDVDPTVRREILTLCQYARRLETALRQIIRDGTTAETIDGTEHVTHTAAALTAFAALADTPENTTP